MKKIRLTRKGVAPQRDRWCFSKEEGDQLRKLGVLDEQIQALQAQLEFIAQLLGVRFARKDKVLKLLESLANAIGRVKRVLGKVAQQDSAEGFDASWRLNTAYMHVAKAKGRHEGDNRLFVDYAREEMGVIAKVANLTIDGNGLGLAPQEGFPMGAIFPGS